METLKYSVIKNLEQYKKYCDILEDLLPHVNNASEEEIELLTVLIEKWEKEHSTFNDADPIELLKALMEEHGLKSRDLADILDLSKGTISKILNYHKGISKDSIRRLSEYFKVSQEAFNRPYKLIPDAGDHAPNTGKVHKTKDLIEA